MKTEIILTIALLAILSLVSAETLSGGECFDVDLSEMASLDNVIYDIVGNSSGMEGMEITLNNTIAEVCFPLNYKEDTFTLIFIDNSSRTITKEVHVGGGGNSGSNAKTIYKDRNITKYVDRYVNETGNETLEENIDDKIIGRKMAIIGLILVMSVAILIYPIILIISSVKRHRDERRLKDETETKEE